MLGGPGEDNDPDVFGRPRGPDQGTSLRLRDAKLLRDTVIRQDERAAASPGLPGTWREDGQALSGAAPLGGVTAHYVRVMTTTRSSVG